MLYFLYSLFNFGSLSHVGRHWMGLVLVEEEKNVLFRQIQISSYRLACFPPGPAAGKGFSLRESRSTGS